MIDTQETIACRACGKPIIQKAGGHRVRVYCDDACKMRHRRRLQSKKQHVEAGEVEATQTQIAQLQARVRELEARLVTLQDVNERFRNDTQVRAFPAWLEKQARHYAESAFGKRFLVDRSTRLLPVRA